VIQVQPCESPLPHNSLLPHNSPFPEPGSQEQPDEFAAADRQKADILVVDDDPSLLEVTRFVLESEGFRVETAKNGEEALQLLRAGKLPRLVLLDLMMPVMNGWQFLEEVARTPSLKTIPIVVLTAAAGSPEVRGAVTVLRKPMDLGLLIDAVERHVRGGE
jgi:two-component system chemotaxis response regulator CheY